MKKDAYAKFTELILEEEIHRYGFVTFGRICRLLEVDRKEFDSLLTDELGLNGRALLRKLRK